MMRNFLLFWIVFLSIIQNIIESKSSKNRKKPKPKNSFPAYIKTPNNIKAYISKELDERGTIASQLYNFPYVSCLRFNLQNHPVKQMGINFFLSKSYNRVQLSTSSKKPTKVLLKKSTLVYTKELFYYIGLALGLMPEIKRFDRDKYVKVFSKNILSKFQSCYKKEKYNDKLIAGTGFDFSSAMLVPPFYGSKRNKKTYKTKLYPYYERTFSVYKVFSHNDLKRINYLYCGNRCNKTNDCHRGGYYNLKCDACNCPMGITGKNCEDIEANDKKCNTKNKLVASKKKKVLLVKNDGRFCVYSITSKKKNVKVTILDLKLSMLNKCEYGVGMEVKYAKDKGALGILLCRNYKNIKLPALSNEVIIIFGNHNTSNLFKVSYREV
uniref:Metalloendopeptidase n=1 Tax=Strongyloides venezuelensis TaxID=75913 RepID=A0A0K0F4E1_STRVS